MNHYPLVSFESMSAEDHAQFIAPLKVMTRATRLNLLPEKLLDPSRWTLLQQECEKAPGTFQSDSVTFTGKTGEELASFLRNNPGKTTILSQDVFVEKTILIPSHVVLDGRGHSIHASTDRIFLFRETQHSGLRNLRIKGEFQTAIYIIHGDSLLIQNLDIRNATARPLVIMGNTRHFYLLENTLEQNARGAIYIRGHVSRGIIRGNNIRDNRSASNFSAGIVLTHLTIEDLNNPDTEKYESIEQRLEFPHDICILDNRIIRQQSSGIYLDGAISLFIQGNEIIENDKEGACLDNGTTGVHFFSNRVERNGRRARQSDLDLEHDFVLRYGRLTDGSAKSKLPGISIDNALYNVILENTIRENSGSGIKMVRTGIRNFIGRNAIVNNNTGQNDRFHFYGIELGAAVLDEEVPFFDAAADYENVIFGNTIEGPHMTGIFLAEEVYQNDLADNRIQGATFYGIESISRKPNYIRGNITHKPVTGLLLENTDRGYGN